MNEDVKIKMLFGYKLLRPELTVKITDIGDGFDCFVGSGDDPYAALTQGITIGLPIGIGVVMGLAAGS